MSQEIKEIESKVPGEQELREGSSDENELKNTDSTFSPVIKITKEETSLTKGELKLQKVIVTEDISDQSTVMQKTFSASKTTGPDTVRTEVRSEVNITSGFDDRQKNLEGTKSSDDEHKDLKKTTRIPKFKLKQAIDKIKKEERMQEITVNEPSLGGRIRSAIPRLKDAKLQNSETVSKKDAGPGNESPKLDDEFDKIYEEIIEKDAFNNNITTPEKIVQQEKLESNFEEIIHAYEDKKVKTKIPMLKRKSEHEIEVPPQINRRRSLRKSISTDDATCKIPVATAMDKTKTHFGKTAVASSKSSASHSLTKSEVASETLTSESVSTVTKTITKVSTIEKVNISAKEDVKIEEINNSEVAKVKEISKCKIPVALYTKEKVETNLLSSSESTQDSKEAKDVNKGVERNVGEYQTISTSEIESNVILTQNSTEIHTSEDITSKISTDSKKVTEISNIDITTENHLTNQVKETVTVATLKYDTSFGSESKTAEFSQNKFSNKVTKDTILSSDISTKETLDIATTDIKTEFSTDSKALVKENVDLTNQVKEAVTVATVKYDTSFGSESKTAEFGQTKVSNEVTKDTILSSDISTKETLNVATTNDIKTEFSVNSNTVLKENVENQQNSNNTTKISHLEINREISETENKKEATVNVTESQKENSLKYDNMSNKVNIENNESLQSKLTTTEVTTVKSLVSNNDIITNTNVSEETSITAANAQNKSNEINAIMSPKTTVKDTETSALEGKEESKSIIKDDPKTSEIDFEETNISDKAVDKAVENVSKDKDKKTVTSNLSTQIKNIDDLEEEDIIILKGKVSRIINRLDSRDQTTTKTEVDDVPKNVSVTSKIAIFEKTDLSEIHNDKEVINKVTEDNDKPKIVEELLKTSSDFDINNKKESIHKEDISNNNNYTKTLKEDTIEKIYSDKSTTFKSDYYSIYNKVHSSIVNRLNSIETKIKHTDTKAEINDNTYINDSRTIIDINDNKNESISIETKVTDTKSEINNNTNNNEANDLKITKGNELKIFNDNIDDTNEVFKRNTSQIDLYKEYRLNKDLDEDRRAKSLAELDIGDAVRGRVRQMVYRMNSMERLRLMRSDTVDRREKLSKCSITNRVAMFEKKSTQIRAETIRNRSTKPVTTITPTLTEEQLLDRINELTNAKTKYGKCDSMTSLDLRDGSKIPSLAIGTALLEPQLIKYIVSAAIDLGYRAIDTAFIYGNEKQIGEAIRMKIEDGTVRREDLYIISKLWSTFHRRDLVEKACKQSLETMGLDYFDLYLIHNPMSFKEGDNPLPKIANVLQYSQHDYLEAWYGIEDVIRKGLVRRGGVSNFNSLQIERVVDKGKIKPVINQVECHPYLTQQRLDDFCGIRHVKLSCFGVLGSKGTPTDLKSGLPPAIDDPLVKVMSAGLGVTPAQLLIAYQLHSGRQVVVKSSSASHLWDNLQALIVKLDQSHLSALNALNRNKRTFTFSGLGDTHRNYPFKIAF